VIRLHYFDLQNPDQSVQSADLRALLDSGWAIQAHFFAEVESKPSLVLLMTRTASTTMERASYLTYVLVVVLMCVQIWLLMGEA